MVIEILKSNRKPIIEKWITMILATYPDKTVRFLSTEVNEFANPVGAIFTFAADELFNQLTGNMNQEKIDEALDCILKVKFVQGNNNDEAVDFLNKLKSAIISIINTKENLFLESEEYRELEEKINFMIQRGNILFNGYTEFIMKLKNKENGRIRFKNLKESRQNLFKNKETISV